MHPATDLQQHLPLTPQSLLNTAAADALPGRRPLVTHTGAYSASRIYRGAEDTFIRVQLTAPPQDDPAADRTPPASGWSVVVYRSADARWNVGADSTVLHAGEISTATELADVLSAHVLPMAGAAR